MYNLLQLQAFYAWGVVFVLLTWYLVHKFLCFGDIGRNGPPRYDQKHVPFIWRFGNGKEFMSKTTRPLSLNILRGLCSEMIQQRWGGAMTWYTFKSRCCWKKWSDIQWVGMTYMTVWCEFYRCEVKCWLWWGFHLQVLMIQLGCKAFVQIVHLSCIHIIRII